MATSPSVVISEDITGTKTSRFAKVTVINHVDARTVAKYETEVLTKLSDGRTINEATDPIEVELIDKQAKYPILDHATGLPTGKTMNDYDLADAVYSRYIFSVTP